MVGSFLEKWGWFIKNSLFIVIYAIVATTLYDLVAEITLNRASPVFYTPLDYMIPFEPLFVIIYVFIFYPFVLFTIGYFAYVRPEKFDRVFVALMIVYAISYLTYLIYPVRMDRPDLSGRTDFLSRVMNKYYEDDLPVNCFPSLHAANSTLSAYFLSREKPKYAFLFWLIAVLVMVSTLFVRQHVIADEIAGFLVAFFASYISEKLISVGPEVKEYFKARVIFTVVLASLITVVMLLAYIP